MWLDSIGAHHDSCENFKIGSFLAQIWCISTTFLPKNYTNFKGAQQYFANNLQLCSQNVVFFFPANSIFTFYVYPIERHDIKTQTSHICLHLSRFVSFCFVFLSIFCANLILPQIFPVIWFSHTPIVDANNRNGKDDQRCSVSTSKMKLEFFMFFPLQTSCAHFSLSCYSFVRVCFFEATP